MSGPPDALPDMRGQNVINIERLDSLVQWATDEQAKKDAGLPSEWDQAEWVRGTKCGTACCLAGKVALEDRVRLDSPHRATSVILPRRIVSIERYAKEVLGLNNAQAAVLFLADNNLTAVVALAEAIKQGVSSWWELEDIQRETTEREDGGY